MIVGLYNLQLQIQYVYLYLPNTRTTDWLIDHCIQQMTKPLEGDDLHGCSLYRVDVHVY